MTTHCLYALLGLAGLASAQQNVLTFDIDQANSDFTWDGTSDLGDIDPDPTNMFELLGTADIRLDADPDPISVGQFVSAAIMLDPEFSGQIPNPLSPLFPPVATLTVSGQVVTVTSDEFPVMADGSFSTSVVLDNIAGDITVNALGSTMMSTLVGVPSSPAPISGTFVRPSTGIDVAGPLTATFNFTDPGTIVEAINQGYFDPPKPAVRDTRTWQQIAGPRRRC